LDVSLNPRKVHDWITYADRERLDGHYDYVWFLDGDITLQSLNWQAFWINVNTFLPKISQASVIGASATSKPGTEWTTLRYQTDARLIAAEVPILELGAPLIEVETWLRYRELILSAPDEVVYDIALGGENCFDMGWCHMAKSNMTGKQERGPIMDYAIAYHQSSDYYSLPVVSHHDYSHGASSSSSSSSSRGRSCIVFYQTPIQHINKKTRGADDTVRRANRNLCRFLRENHGVTGAGGLWTVYDLFTAPNNASQPAH
ncbi:hypothetical protein ACHAXR_001408, partial [Thalassiosira sp. AJA248-18]